jgi:RNA ligase
VDTGLYWQQIIGNQRDLPIQCMTHHATHSALNGDAMTETKKANHQANIVRVMQVLPHPKPDTTNLEIIPNIGGYQVVVRKGDFKPGDLAVYIQPDSVVPQTMPFKFIWDKDSSVTFDPNYGNTYTDVPDKKRRITVRRFRGEWSEGLLMPWTDFAEQFQKAYTGKCPACDWEEFVKTATAEELEAAQPSVHKHGGQNCKLAETKNVLDSGKLLAQGLYEDLDVSDILGITHYDPDAGKENTYGNNMHAPRKKGGYPKTFRGWLFFLLHKIGIRTRHSDNDSRGEKLGIPSYDVDALKNYKNVFKEGERVIVTEKIHGSNARYVFVDGVMYAGSKNYWKSPDSKDIWRRVLEYNPSIQHFCEAHPGYVLYGEVTPTQGNKYNYGSNDPQFFLFDIRTPDGRWLDYDEMIDMLETDPNGAFIQRVPFIARCPYHADFSYSSGVEGFTSYALSVPPTIALADGPSLVPYHDYIREGVVIKAEKERKNLGTSLNRAQLKVVSNQFLAKDK